MTFTVSKDNAQIIPPHHLPPSSAAAAQIPTKTFDTRNDAGGYLRAEIDKEYGRCDYYWNLLWSRLSGDLRCCVWGYYNDSVVEGVVEGFEGCWVAGVE